MLEITPVQIAAVLCLFTAGGALWALFKLIQNTTDAVRKELMAGLDKQEAVNSKTRHDEKAGVTAMILKLEVEVDRLKRETVRREDMAAIETRLTAAVVKIEGKVDTMVEKLSSLKSVERQVENLDARLQLVVPRMGPSNAGAASAGT